MVHPPDEVDVPRSSFQHRSRPLCSHRLTTPCFSVEAHSWVSWVPKPTNFAGAQSPLEPRDTWSVVLCLLGFRGQVRVQEMMSIPAKVVICSHLRYHFPVLRLTLHALR